MRRLVLVLVWLVFVFLLLELAGFVFYKLEVSKPVSGYGYPAGLIVAHPQLGYSYQPHYSGHFKGTAYQDIPIEINAQGFRDADFSAASGDGERVAVLGDSVVFGAGVSAKRSLYGLSRRIWSHGPGYGAPHTQSWCQFLQFRPLSNTGAVGILRC